MPTCAWTRLTLSIKIKRDTKICTAFSKSNGAVDWLSNTVSCNITRWNCNHKHNLIHI